MAKQPLGRFLQGARLPSTENVSPDGQWILFTRQDRAGSDLTLVEDFR